MCQKSHVSTKYAQTFATSALVCAVYTLSLARVKRERVQHKSSNTLHTAASLTIYKTNTRTNGGAPNAGVAVAASDPCGLLSTRCALLLEMRLALLCAVLCRLPACLSVLSCFCLRTLFWRAGLSPSLASLVFRLLLRRRRQRRQPPGSGTVGCSTTRVCFFPRLRRATTVRLNFVRVLRIVLF